MKRIRKPIYAAVLIAAGALVPQIFHYLGGAKAGMMFLPMHIPVLICGLLLGSLYGFAAGLLIPFLSFLITGGAMPSAERLPFVIAELALYGFASGLFAALFKNVYLALISAMISGRLLYAGLLCVAFYVFHMKNAAPIAVWNSFVQGIAGVIIQLVIIPPVVYVLKRYFNDRTNQQNNTDA
ncbi:MAG TPA: ECF transporter S component [Bacillota bacterium]|nr:ECF transporter S component [Bacillota bacterium]